jgi:hypothetical protein
MQFLIAIAGQGKSRQAYLISINPHSVCDRVFEVQHSRRHRRFSVLIITEQTALGLAECVALNAPI